MFLVQQGIFWINYLILVVANVVSMPGGVGFRGTDESSANLSCFEYEPPMSNFNDVPVRGHKSRRILRNKFAVIEIVTCIDITIPRTKSR